jgi:hypothetical protein
VQKLGKNDDLIRSKYGAEVSFRKTWQRSTATVTTMARSSTFKTNHANEIDQGYLKTGSLGEYLGLKGRLRKISQCRSSPVIIRTIKSRRIKWAGQTLHIGRVRNACEIWSQNLKGKDHWENLGEDILLILLL